MSDWISLFRKGLLSQARRTLGDGPRKPFEPSAAVTWAELLYLLGSPSEARRIAADVLSASEVSHPLRAKAVSVVAGCFYDLGRFEESVRESQRALELSETAKDWPTAALAISHLIERRSLVGVVDVVPLVPQARKYALRSGDVQSVSQVHLVFGRVEGRAGHYDRALRHFEISRAVLGSEPNLWVDAAIDLGQASILSLIGDHSTAMEVTQRARLKSQESGWAKGCAVAAVNLANMWVLLGEPERAEEVLRESPASFPENPTYSVAVAETRAQALICRHDFEGARAVLAEIRLEDAPNLGWYKLSCFLTEAQVLIALESWEEALECAAAGLRLAPAGSLHPACVGLRLCQAQARIGLGQIPSARDIGIGVGTTDAIVDSLAAMRQTQARALVALGQTSRAVEHNNCARRLWAASGSAPAVVRAGIAISSSVEPSRGVLPLPSPNLDSAVTLLDLAGHPHVLGREALAVIEGAACTDAVALVATGGSSPRIIEQRGWNERDVVRAVETTPEGIEVLPVGRYRDEMWQIVARPKTAIDPYCTFAAIRKLLATAVAIDQYRRDEKQRAALWPADALEGDPDAIWASEQMAETLSIARRIAPTPISVLLTGETGTGKEMLARALHRASDRADKPFLPFNCTAVPRDMLESQLFGYKKGAFTGADTAFGGVIRAAAGGTLFLDEIADVSLDVQPKLLRFLETREIHPLGEPQPIRVDVRIVAATNAALEKLVAEGRFREDLFYRLNTVHLKLPPLRERREEIPPLVHHYLRRYGDEQRKGRLTLSDEALEYLLLFSWPGNVRQLANEVRRVVAMIEPDTTITPAMLSAEIQASRRTIPAPTAAQEELRLPLDQPLPAAVQLLEQVMVRRALDRSHGRVEEASRILGISRKGLFLKRRRLGFRTAS